MNVVEENAKNAPIAWLPNARPIVTKGLTPNRRDKKPKSPTCYSSILRGVAGTLRRLLSILILVLNYLSLSRAKSKEISPRSTRRSAKTAAPPAPSLALRSYLPELACQSPDFAVCRLFAVSAESLNDHLVCLVCTAFLDVYDRYLYGHKCSGLRFGWNDRRECASSKATSAPCAASAITPPGNIRYDPASHSIGYARTVIIRRSDAARTLTRSDDEEIFASPR
jgi:hypothetical protein